MLCGNAVCVCAHSLCYRRLCGGSGGLARSERFSNKEEQRGWVGPGRAAGRCSAGAWQGLAVWLGRAVPCRAGGTMPSYTVTVATGSQWFAGTDDYVYLSLEGTAGCSERHLLDKPFYNDFERGAVSAGTAPAQPAVPVPLLPGWGWASGQASRGSELSIATLNGSCKTAPGTGLGWRWAVRGAARAHPVACAVLCPAAISYTPTILSVWISFVYCPTSK